MGVSDGGDLWRFLRVRLPLIALATIVLVGLAVAHLNTTAELSCFSRLRRYVAPCHLHIAPLSSPFIREIERTARLNTGPPDSLTSS